MEEKQPGIILEEMFFEAMKEAGYHCIQTQKGSLMDSEQGVDILLFTGLQEGRDTVVRLDITANNKRDAVMNHTGEACVPVRSMLKPTPGFFSTSIRIANPVHKFEAPVLVIELDPELIKMLYRPNEKWFVQHNMTRYMKQLNSAVLWFNKHLPLVEELYY